MAEVKQSNDCAKFEECENRAPIINSMFSVLVKMKKRETITDMEQEEECKTSPKN